MNLTCTWWGESITAVPVGRLGFVASPQEYFTKHTQDTQDRQMPGWGVRSLCVEAGRQRLSQGHRQDTERRQRSSMWFTATCLHDCQTTRRSRGRWEQPTVVSWQRQTERKKQAGKNEQTEIRRKLVEVRSQSAGWHFLSLRRGKWSVSAPVLSHPSLHAEQLQLALQPPLTHTLTTTTIILPQFSEISQQTCDSSFRVIGPSCIRLRGLTARGRLKEHRETT